MAGMEVELVNTKPPKIDPRFQYFSEAQMKEVKQNDATALSVVAALFTTVSMSALMIGEAEFKTSNTANTPMSVVYVCSHTIASTSGLACVWIGSMRYLKLNMTPNVAFDEIDERLSKIAFPCLFTTPFGWAIINTHAVIIGLASGVYLLNGPLCFFISLPIFLLALFQLQIIWYHFNSAHYKGMKEGSFVERKAPAP